MSVPFHTFILKVASRCNLNCTYCFVYNLADSRWQQQPALMSRDTAWQAVSRIREHCEAHEKKTVSVIFHGGEPLLGGVKHLRELSEVVDDVFHDSGIMPTIGLQSNGLLFTSEVGDLLLQKHASMGISIDGPPEINDLYRLDHSGRPSSTKLEEKLHLLLSDRYRPLFSGFLCVINVSADPLAVFRYLDSFNPPDIDFLLPYDNYDRRPRGKENFDATPYADWLIKIFDYWFERKLSTKIRIFDSFIRLVLGAQSLVESIGLEPVDLIVVETNGDIEGVDSLKGTYEGATCLGLNVFDHDFDIASQHIAVRNRQMGSDALCQKCQACQVLCFCGGGYLPNRYSAERGFDNPSIFCTDLEKLIRHIHSRVSCAMQEAKVNVA
jgi:uncharacterized protein